MKKTIILLFMVFLFSGNTFAHSGDSITVPSGTIPTIDGINSSGEWTDALAIQTLTTGFYSYIYIKHSATHLYVAFNSLYSASVGIYIDKQHNASSSPQSDDVWIHGSAGPYEFIGNGSSWQQQSNPVNWNFMVNTANQFSEFQILLSKIGITAGENKLGVLFSFIDWSMSHTDEITWPAGGYPNCINPASWANMKLSLATSIENNTGIDKAFKIYPNPATDYFIIEGYGNNKSEYTIYNLVGQAVKSGKIESNVSKITVTDLKSGIYFVKLQSGTEAFVYKIIKK